LRRISKLINTKKHKSMKNTLFLYFILIFLLSIGTCNNLKSQNSKSKYIIHKNNGSIIQGYKAFNDFLNSDKSWESYKKIVLDAYPEMQAVHDKALSWGSINPLKFPEELKNYKTEDWKQYFDQQDEITLNSLYDSILTKANTIIAPINNNPIDLCLFLPYSGCFVLPEKDKSTICISLLISPNDRQKIMAHEYAHNLHFQRRPEEPLSLKREIVYEGMAVYLTTLIINDPNFTKSIPFMPETSVKWCLENESTIKDSIKVDLNDSTVRLFIRYIADGGPAVPPKGFVEKTGYFAGYRIIKACIDKGMKLEEICSLKSEEVIAKSGYFN